MESQPQNPEFRIDPENFHPCVQGHAQKNIFRKTIDLRILKFYRLYNI